MIRDIKTINLWATNLILRGAGGVNCCLVRTDAGYVLIDAGFHARRADMVKELEAAGSRPGGLAVITVTHGDLYHTGNCAHLRDRYGARVAVHHSEFEAVESGNMARSRKGQQDIIARACLSFVSLLSQSDRSIPDLRVEDGHAQLVGCAAVRVD